MRSLAALSLLVPCAFAQTTADSVGRVVETRLQHPEVTAAQLRAWLVKLVPRLEAPARASDWTADSARLRRRALDVIWHGWPREWVDAPPRFDDLGPVPAGKGYRLRKLRYEIVPGFWSSALLYEPETLTGAVPAILNVNGHEPEGKSIEYIQKRCINQARQGILALNLEWIGMGELRQPENEHWFEAHLDLAGANGVGLFYLAMRRGLDWLDRDPRVDRKRIGVTGLSGGGWQTIVLSALDERVRAALPDAGYLSNLSIGGVENVGDNEQSATDLGAAVDYAQLTAMRAPRPTLLIFNEEDNCCFRAPRMKPFVFDPVRPVFALYGARDRFEWYENTDPGDHNYQLDNRMQSYDFFARAFGIPPPKAESPAGPDIKTAAELDAGLPPSNLTILGLARKLAAEVRARPPARLEEIVRYHPVEVTNAWPVANTWGKGVKTVSYRFDFSNGLSASGTLFTSAQSEGTTILIADQGRSAARAAISELVNRGRRVLALDLVLYGDAAPPKVYYPLYDRMMATLGERSLGVEAAQLLAVARWLQAEDPQLESGGIRTQAVALVAAALDRSAFAKVVIREGLSSWATVFAKPIRYQDAPELFCLDLYKFFDIEDLSRIASR